MDEATLASGTVIANNYRVTTRLGAGGMGTVYLADNVTLNQRVVVKVLRGAQVGAGQEEAQLLASIQHPHVVTVYAHDPALDCIVMEFLDGVSLTTLLEKGIDRVSAIRVSLGVAEALAAVHKRGLVHRDIKPDNIMLALLTGGGRVVDWLKLIDFGIALKVGKVPPAPLGTPEFCAPEQFVRGAAAMPANDVYALGITLYLLITGRFPYAGEVAELLKHHQFTPPPSLVDTLVELHGDDTFDPRTRTLLEDLDELVRSMLAKRIEERPSATDVARQLTRLESSFADAGTFVGHAGSGRVEVPGSTASASYPRTQAMFAPEAVVEAPKDVADEQRPRQSDADGDAAASRAAAAVAAAIASAAAEPTVGRVTAPSPSRPPGAPVMRGTNPGLALPPIRTSAPGARPSSPPAAAPSPRSSSPSPAPVSPVAAPPAVVVPPARASGPSPTPLGNSGVPTTTPSGGSRAAAPKMTPGSTAAVKDPPPAPFPSTPRVWVPPTPPPTPPPETSLLSSRKVQFVLAVIVVLLASALGVQMMTSGDGTAPWQSGQPTPPPPKETPPEPTDPNAVPTDPNAVPTDPNAVPTDPNAVSADAGAVSADAGEASTDAGEASTDAGETSTDAGAAPTAPAEVPPSTATTPTKPAAAPADAGTASRDAGVVKKGPAAAPKAPTTAPGDPAPKPAPAVKAAPSSCPFTDESRGKYMSEYDQLRASGSREEKSAIEDLEDSLSSAITAKDCRAADGVLRKMRMKLGK